MALISKINLTIDQLQFIKHLKPVTSEFKNTKLKEHR